MQHYFLYKGKLAWDLNFFSPLFCIRDEDENEDEDGLDWKKWQKCGRGCESRVGVASKPQRRQLHTPHTHNTHTTHTLAHRKVLVLANSILGRNIPLSIL